MRHMARLPDKTTDNLGGIGNHSPRRNDKILRDNAVANIHRSIHIPIDRTVIEPGTVFDRSLFGIRCFARSPCIFYLGMVADKTIVASLPFGKIGNHRLQTQY